MSIDLFETRRMIASLEQRKRPFSFFLSTFYREEDLSETAHIDIDIDRGGKRVMAAFVNSKLQGQAVTRRGFKTRSYKPPYVKPKRPTTAEDCLKRGMGESVYTASSPLQRAGQILGKDLGGLDDMIIMREEWMAACGVQTGQVIVQGEGVDDVLDFDMLDSHKPVLGGTDIWTAHSTARPLRKLRDWSELIQEDSGKVPTVGVFGKTAWNNFMDCDEISGSAAGKKSLFDLRAIDVGRIDPQMLAMAGVTYQGYLKEINMDMYTYVGTFYNDVTGETEYLMNPNKVLLGCTDARCVRHYGVIDDIEALVAVRRFPKTWIEKDPGVRQLLVQSAPLMANHQPDAFVCATVC